MSPEKRGVPAVHISPAWAEEEYLFLLWEAVCGCVMPWLALHAVTFSMENADRESREEGCYLPWNDSIQVMPPLAAKSQRLWDLRGKWLVWKRVAQEEMVWKRGSCWRPLLLFHSSCDLHWEEEDQWPLGGEKAGYGCLHIKEDGWSEMPCSWWDIRKPAEMTVSCWQKWETCHEEEGLDILMFSNPLSLIWGWGKRLLSCMFLTSSGGSWATCLWKRKYSMKILWSLLRDEGIDRERERKNNTRLYVRKLLMKEAVYRKMCWL